MVEFAQNAANKKDVASCADFLEEIPQSRARRTTCPVPRNTDADGRLSRH